MVATKEFIYKDSSGKEKVIEISGDELSLFLQSKKDYETSRSYIDSYYIHIWRYQMKRYHMSMADRALSAGLQPWQSNISMGISRSFIDVFTSTLTERPIAFSATGYDDKGIENKDSVQHALAVTADITDFQTEARHILSDGLKVGQFSVEIGMFSDKKTYTGYVIDGDDIREITYTSRVHGFPYAKRISVFDLFPDIGYGTARYSTKREIMSYQDAFEAYERIINSSDNKSPLKGILPFLQINPNGADFSSRNSIVNQIHQRMNEQLARSDAFPTSLDTRNSNVTIDTHDKDTRFNDGLIEVLFYARNDSIVLTMNGYPVYIGKNHYEFIPFMSQSIQDENDALGCEGIPYLIGDLEGKADAFMNNFLDGARSVSTPSFAVPKGMLINLEAVKNLGPGTVVEYDPIGGQRNPIERIDKGGLSDLGIYDRIMEICQRLTGISEYNLGGSSKERTATGALATTQSSQKRLSPMLTSFVSLMSEIGEKFLKLERMYWTENKRVGISGTEFSVKDIGAEMLDGNIAIGLQMDSMFSSINEFAYKKILEVFSQTRATGLVNEDEIVREIFRTQGLSPTRFVPESAPKVTAESQIPAPQDVFSSGGNAQDIAGMATPSVDLGNMGQGTQG